MKTHTYTLLMALIRLAKGMLCACEDWVRIEKTPAVKPDTVNASKVTEE